jgi:type I restriction enzyme, S subunit
MPIEFHRDGPWEVPEGWVWSRLGDVCKVNESPSFDNLPDNLEIPFVPMSAVAEEIGRVDLSQRRRVSELRSGYTRFHSGDVLFAKITPCMENGKTVALPEIAGGYGAGSTEFHTLRSRVLEARYLWYWLVRKGFRNNAQRNMRGAVGQLRVPLDYLRGVQIAVPPLAEQRRIVARIDELFTAITDGETALARARDDLDTWRRALLKAAVTGQLTREWRETNKSNESGADVLARVAKARIGYKTTKARGRKLIVEEIDEDALPEIPDTWAWGLLGELGDIVGGVTVDKKRRPLDPVTVPYLRVANVQRGRLDLAEIKTITVDRDDARALCLQAGDILLNEGGDRDKIGRGWVWSGEIDKCIHQNHVFRVRLFDRSINPYFISHFANEMGRRFFVEKGKQTTNLASISMSRISQLRVPIPPTAEMEEAMRLLDRTLLATVDVEAQLVAASISHHARQSVLKSAFRGRLVEQNPSDESADLLLARLSESVNGRLVERRLRRSGNATLATE